MKGLEFVKMHGIGNDFVVFDGISQRLTGRKWNELSLSICDRYTGVGADGVILVLPSRKADYKMRIFNSDGSEAEMCGNGLRCLVRMLHDRGYLSGRDCEIEAMKSIIGARIVSLRKAEFLVGYNVGRPSFLTSDIPVKSKQKFFVNSKVLIGRKNYVVTSLSIGNPHTVAFVDDIDFDWRFVGMELESHPIFPNRTNVEFVLVSSPKRVLLRSWERGAGPTLASGTGACAAVAAGVMVGLLAREVEVVCELGSLMVEWGDDGELYQTGPAEYCFTGHI
jgi:diaminopimelate epimerase